MKAVLTGAEAREQDRVAIEQVGVPGIALMEVASRAVAARVLACADVGRDQVVVVCGGGNNGGDGYGAARWLHGWGVDVATWSLTPHSRGDAAVMRAASVRAGVPEVDGLGAATLVVDAVFGTGLGRAVHGRLAAAIKAIVDHGAPVVAVDLPSGVCSDTGAVLGIAVHAQHTVSFGHLKVGLCFEPGASLAGEVFVADIGLGVVGGDHGAEMPEPCDLARCWPVRARGAHKGHSGHVFVVAGSVPMAGAAVLACRAALAAGAGLVTLAAPRAALARLGQLPPEVMVAVHGESDLVQPPPVASLGGYASVLVGPGLGGGAQLAPALAAWLRELWAADGPPAVFDADALVCAVGRAGSGRVVTPHPGEAGRMLGRTTTAVQADRLDAARALAASGAVAVLKGRSTVVASGDEPASINPTGGPVLSTAGSGDVLSGVIAALLARGTTPRDAARLGAWVHGAAGDHLAAVRADGWTASDVAAAVPRAAHALTGAGL